MWHFLLNLMLGYILFKVVGVLRILFVFFWLYLGFWSTWKMSTKDYSYVTTVDVAWISHYCSYKYKCNDAKSLKWITSFSCIVNIKMRIVGNWDRGWSTGRSGKYVSVIALLTLKRQEQWALVDDRLGGACLTRPYSLHQTAHIP